MSRTSVVAWLVFGTLTVGYPSLAAAIDTTTIYLEFASGAIDAEPFARAGTICVDTPSGTVTLTELVPVLGCVPVLPRTSPAYVIDGPYKVTLYGTKDGAAIAGHLMTRAIVAYATGDDADVPVSSENAVIDVPDDEFFCQNHQQYIRVEGEPDVGCSHTAVSYDYDYDLLQAWAITKGSSDILIAIIDTGVDWTHPDLGGPGLLPGVPDSLLYSYYQGGPIRRNEDEEIGDASQDSIPVPGLPWVDDDDDGKIDEDSWNHSRTEVGEPEVRDGIVSAVSGYTIVDSSASFSPEDSLVGLWLYGNAVSEFGTYGFAVDSIIAYTDTSITTAGIGIFKAIEDDGGPTLNWSSFALPGVPYKTGDLQNNDPEEDMETDEWSWKNDIPNDDDENGWVDDVIGWDFVDIDPSFLTYPHAAEDYRREDGDPRSLYDHGTANAAIIAATDNADGFGIVGISPGGCPEVWV